MLSGKVWLNSGPVAVRNDGEWHSSDKTLLLRNTTAFDGEDQWGMFTTTEFWWSSRNGAFNFVASISAYVVLPVITFVQVRTMIYYACVCAYIYLVYLFSRGELVA